MSLLRDAALEQLLETLHERSTEQIAAIERYAAEELAAGSLSAEQKAVRRKAFRRDKLVALDRDKAEFCYQVCRATDARRIVEIGTSYGVSTLYLAAAVRDNVRARGGSGLVIGTEYEPEKARAAATHFKTAGLDGFIDLREGDLRETLADIDVAVDFMLVDVWISMARPALELVYPHLRPGAIVVCDNTEQERDAYADYFSFLL
jgi:predicted O-methyltransferase YrrM